MQNSITFSPDLLELLGLLNENKVTYLIVGGYAVAFHGHPRYTGDIDVWLKPDEKNAIKLIHVLNVFGLASLNLQPNDLLAKDSVIQIGYPPNRIDMMTTIDGVDFNESYERKVYMKIGAIEVPIIGLEDLRTNKKATGRHRDLDDLENLPKK